MKWGHCVWGVRRWIVVAGVMLAPTRGLAEEPETPLDTSSVPDAVQQRPRLTAYLQRQNLVRTLPFLAYRTRDNLDGVKLLRGYDGSGKIRFKSFWIVAVDAYRYDVRFEDREVGDGTAIQRPTAYGLDVSLSTDPRRQMAGSFSTESLFYRDRGGSFTLDDECSCTGSRCQCRNITRTSSRTRGLQCTR